VRTAIIIAICLCGAFGLSPARAAEAGARPPAATAAQDPGMEEDDAEAPEEEANGDGEDAAPAEEAPAPDASAPAAAAQPPAPAAPAAVGAPAQTPEAAAEQPAPTAEQPAAGTEEAPAETEPTSAPAAAPGPAAAPQTPPASGAPSAPLIQARPWSDYQDLIDRNIFSRVRGPRPQPVRTVSAAPRPPERYMVLKGTLGGDNGYVAFVEDSRTGETRVCQAGDMVGQARITAVGIGGLTYEQNGTTTRAAIGDYVGGAIPAGAAPAGPATSATPPATAAPAPAGSAAALLERLRQRRLQEEGK
jgi:hypothetical protein